jgi:hypothetical protein
MDNFIIEKFICFRNKIKSLFHYSAEALMNVIDAIAGNHGETSVVKLTLGHLFSRHYSTISCAVKNLFRRQPMKNPISAADRQKGAFDLTKLFVQQCPNEKERSFVLYGMDVTPTERLFANKLEDRSMVYMPNRIYGKTPVTVGHQYSLLACLPEKTSSSSMWSIPLSIQRVKSQEKGPELGMNQLKQVLDLPELKDQFSVNVADCAYGSQGCIKKAEQFDNMVHIARARGNRVLYYPLEVSQEGIEKKIPGRPKKFGATFYFKDPPEAEESVVLCEKTKRGHTIFVKCERWTNLLMRGEDNCAAFDVVRITVIDEHGQPVHLKPLWLFIVGKKRSILTLEQIFKAYSQRYDLEHFFRFGKRRLLLDKSQTPDVLQEENWWWLCLIAYTMLYQSRDLANDLPYPWEKKRQSSTAELSPSRVQRDYERIIEEIGAMPSFPKTRGKSFGRKKGQIINKRPTRVVIKKWKKKRKRKKVA